MRKSKASEALRVAQQVAAIRAALKKHGYRICKRPRQAAWTITPLNPQKITAPLARGSGRKLAPPLAREAGEKLTPPLAREAGEKLTPPLTREAGEKLTPPLTREAGEKLTPPLTRGAGGVNEETAGTHTNKSYLLTYQPAPISAWVLHPQNNDPDRHTLETIIQRAITKSAS